MKKETPISVRFLQIALLIITAVLAYFAYLVFQPAPDVKVTEPVKLSKTNVTKDDNMKLEVAYCSEATFTERIDVQLVDVNKANSATTLFTIDEAGIEKGCHNIDIDVDTNTFQAFSIRTGEYKLRIRASVKVNPIRYEVRKHTSEIFTYTKE